MMPGAAPRTGRFPTLLKYDVLEELGHGGMATVYRAHDKRLGRDVAVKVIHPHLRDSQEVAHRFSVEAQAVAKLRHVNIVEVYDVSAEDEPEQYLVVELLRGRTLRKILQTHGALPPEVAVAIAIELLSALAHAHAAGVIHRDVKPENVILEHHSVTSFESHPRSTPGGQPGDRVVVKLTDFGIAKLLDAQGVTSTGQVLGSPAHMAPEQIEGGDVDGRADIFAMGVLLYECLVGHLPFEGGNPAQVLRRVLDGVYPSADCERPIVGRRWADIVDRALAKKPEDRFADALAMRDALASELLRLRITVPRGELEGWCDDPAAFQERHRKQMIACLGELAGAARSQGNALSAAADYNRALAYAPNDAALLKIVSRLHGAEQRKRILQRIVPIVFGALAMAGTAFWVTRAVRGHPSLDNDVPTLPATVVADVAPPVPALVVSGLSPPKRPGPSVLGTAAGARVVATPKIVPREILLATVRPMHGVLVGVDDGEPTEVEEGKAIAVDSGAHTLHFSCKKDAGGNPVCEPQEKGIAAGEGALPLTVRLTIKPALLRLTGDPKNTYGLVEYPPSLRLLVGDVTTIALSDSAAPIVHVIERETNRTKGLQLHAGKQDSVNFLDEAP